MATKKITLSAIKQLIKSGAAIDIDEIKGKKPAHGDLEKIGVSFGTLGMNGALFLHRKTRKMYAIKARNSTLMYYV